MQLSILSTTVLALFTQFVHKERFDGPLKLVAQGVEPNVHLAIRCMVGAASLVLVHSDT